MTCPVVRKASQKHQTRKLLNGQNVFLSFPSSSSSSDGLVQNCMTLSWWFSHKPATFYTECTSPLLFHNFEVSHGGSNQSLKNCGFIGDAIFFTCMHAHKPLSNKTIIILVVELEIRLCAWRQGESLSSDDWCLNRAWSMIFQPIHLLRKPMRTDLLLWDRWKTSAQAWTCC